ncbi:MAG: hypothetical protein Kow0029_05400 [Candidatus Rifleibacteriota bacterium]
MKLKEDLNRLNEQQANIVKKFNKPALIVAGPGTGKTRTISVLIGDLLAKGIRLKEILALTFSDKAANELRERVLEYYPHSFDQCWISTFHSFCARILREQYHRIFVKPDFKLLTGFKEALLMAGICKKQDIQAFAEFGKVLNKRGFQQEILTFISLLKSNLVDHEEFNLVLRQSSEFGKRVKNRLLEIANLYKLYEQERKKTGYLDFRDLISLSIKVLQIPEVAQIYQQKFRVILVDEFQDTDPAQYLLLTLLKGNSENTKIAVVGDPRQSIYRFRGADPGMMTAQGPFKNRYKAKIFPLQKNYRCAKKIIDVATKLNWKEKSDQDKNLIPCSTFPGFVELFKASDELEEARLVTRKIAALLIYGREKKYKPEDIAILVRNNYQIDLLAENLQALHIPFEIAGDMKFFKSEEIIVLASLLKIAATEGAQREEAILRAFSSPLFELNPLWVQAIISEIGPIQSLTNILEKISNNDFENLPETDDIQKIKAGYFVETIKILENCANQPIEMTIARILLSLKNILRDPSSPQARNAIHFRNMISDFAELFKRQNGREALVADLIDEFDEWLTYYASTLELEGNTESTGVKIMTVHQSKGLEFPIVAIPGLCEGLFPVNLRENLLISTRNIEKLKNEFDKSERQVSFFNPYPGCHEDHLEEERRLFFVALTRAKEGVILSYPLKQSGDVAIPAPFLREIGLTAQEDQIEQRPLNISEFRIKLATLDHEALKKLDDKLQIFDNLIDEKHSVHGIRPRNFSKPDSDEIVLPENFVFSASSLKNYLDCPRKFYFLNIIKIQDPLKAKQSWFQTGNALHALFEELHRPGSIWENGKFPDSDDLEMLFSSKCLPFLDEIEFFQRHQDIESIKACLPNYVEALFSKKQLPPRQTYGVEKNFEFTFHHCKFKGRFDRIVMPEPDSALVIDYKTSQTSVFNSDKIFERAFPKEGLPNEIQMPLYLMACRQAGIKKASAIILYVRKEPYKKNYGNMQAGYLRSAALNLGCGPDYGIHISDETFQKFEETLQRILDEIVNNRTFDCNPSNHPEARTCLNIGQNKKPMCEFYSFCQEKLEQKRQDKIK